MQYNHPYIISITRTFEVPFHLSKIICRQSVAPFGILMFSCVTRGLSISTKTIIKAVAVAFPFDLLQSLLYFLKPFPVFFQSLSVLLQHCTLLLHQFGLVLGIGGQGCEHLFQVVAHKICWI